MHVMLTSLALNLIFENEYIHETLKYIHYMMEIQDENSSVYSVAAIFPASAISTQLVSNCQATIAK